MFSDDLLIFQLTIQQISSKTGLHIQDIALALFLLEFIKDNSEKKFLLAVDWNKVVQHVEKVKKSYLAKTR
jgi:hypothetical protein